MQVGVSATTRARTPSRDQEARPILLVDDEWLFTRTLADLFEDQGYTVLTAADGSAALELVQRYQPGLVLLDLRMPGMSGEEAARRILSQPGAPTVVILTAWVSPQQQARLLDMGAAAVLTKPAPIGQLLHLVQTLYRPPAGVPPGRGPSPPPPGDVLRGVA